MENKVVCDAAMSWKSAAEGWCLNFVSPNIRHIHSKHFEVVYSQVFIFINIYIYVDPDVGHKHVTING